MPVMAAPGAMVKKPAVANVPAVNANVPVIFVAPLLIVAPAVLLSVSLAKLPVPLMVWADEPLALKLPVILPLLVMLPCALTVLPLVAIVPLLFNAPVTVNVFVFCRAAPLFTVSEATETLLTIVGAKGVPHGIVAASLLVGGPVGVQLLPVAHALVPPVQV